MFFSNHARNLLLHGHFSTPLKWEVLLRNIPPWRIFPPENFQDDFNRAEKFFCKIPPGTSPHLKLSCQRESKTSRLTIISYRNSGKFASCKICSGKLTPETSLLMENSPPPPPKKCSFSVKILFKQWAGLITFNFSLGDVGGHVIPKCTAIGTFNCAEQNEGMSQNFVQTNFVEKLTWEGG